MYLNIITGNSIVTKVLFIIALLFVCGDLLITLFTIYYQRYLYDHKIRNRFDATYSPRCAIIVPCKGAMKNLENNVRGFLRLDYKDYKVIYAVETENDKAAEIINKIITDDPKAELAVAGLAVSCVQKNQNLLAGLKMAQDAEVYVFADADIKPHPSWLKELILPLADPKITVTTGFRWLHARNGTLGELAHSYVNIFMYILFSVACYTGGVGLWGGSMAIRKKDFEELGVADKWARAGVDDMSLSKIIYQAQRKAVIVPRCIIQSDDLLQTVRGTIRWFERQIMYLKAYQKKLWFLLALPVTVCGFSLILLMPFALISALSPDRTFLASGGGAAVLFYAGELVTISLYPFLGSMYSMKKLFLFWPFLRFTQAISYFLTLMTNTITWAGIRYRLAFNGDVTCIERPAEGDS